MIFEQNISRSTDTYLGIEQRLAKLYATYWGSEQVGRYTDWAAPTALMKVRWGGLIIWLMSLITGAAHASDVAWYVGRTVDEVRIEAVDGQLLEADMTPILRLQPGGPLDSGDMRPMWRCWFVRAVLLQWRRWSRKPPRLKPRPSA